MTALCTCSHSWLCHEVEDAPECCQCGCTGYHALQPGETPRPVHVDAVTALLRRAKDSTSKRIVGLAERIEIQLADLDDRLRAEHARLELERRARAGRATRREVADLNRQIAERRKTLGRVA